MAEAAKNCTICGQEKPATPEYFHAFPGGKGGLRADCKECRNACNKRYRAEHREAVSVRNKAYREANRETILARERAHVQANPDAYRARINEWHKRNRDKANVWVRNYRARLKKASGSHTYADIQFLLKQQRGLCACCRVDIRKSFQVDHVIAVSMGGSNDKSNLQLLCKACNSVKRARDPVEFMQSRGFLL